MNTDARLATVIKILLGLCIAVAVVLAALYFYQNQKNTNASIASSSKNSGDTKTANVSPTPNPLPKGKQSFTVNGGKKNGIEWKSVEVDPYDPTLNQKQAFTAKIISDADVTKMTVTVISDTKKSSFPLTRVDGTGKNGSWQGSWTVDDTHNYIYSALVTADNSLGGDTLTLTFR